MQWIKKTLYKKVCEIRTTLQKLSDNAFFIGSSIGESFHKQVYSYSFSCTQLFRGETRWRLSYVTLWQIVYSCIYSWIFYNRLSQGSLRCVRGKLKLYPRDG